MDGTIADDFSKIADADMRTSVQPLAASNNGIAEFSIGDKNFAIFTISNQLQTPWTAMRLVSWDANMSFASMKPLYNLPKDGMGDISNGERTHVPAIHVNSTTGLARIVMFCGRGGAAAYDFGTKEAICCCFGGMCGLMRLTASSNGACNITSSNKLHMGCSPSGAILGP